MVRGLLNLNFPASLSAAISLHLITALLAVPAAPDMRPRQRISPSCPICVFLPSTSPPGSLPQTPVHFKDVSTL